MKLRHVLPALVIAGTAIVPLAGSAQTERTGTVASVQGSSFTLNNGTTVFMHQGTVINPTGSSLEPGMRVVIRGDYDGRRRLNADEVDLSGRGRGNGTYSHYYQNGWRDRNGNFHPYR